MCGIAGVYIKDPTVISTHEGLESFIDDLLLGIEHRGRKATGFVAVAEDGKVMIDKAPLTATEFIKNRERLPVGTHTVLLHTRLDTKGSPNDSRNNHPVIHKTCFTVHNGWVRNDDELFEEGGYERVGEVDSEVIAAMLYETDFDIEKMKVAFDKMEGAVACATIDPIRHPKELILAKVESSPLEYVDAPRFIVWASEKKAIREAWGKHIGTPPKDKRISSLDRLKMLVVNKEGEITEVKIPYTPKGYSTFPTSGRRHGTASGWENSATRTPTSNASPAGAGALAHLVTNSEIKSSVMSLRGGSGGKAKLWENKGRYSMAVQLGPWHLCSICETRVNNADLRSSLKGEICTDCYEAWMAISVAKRNSRAKSSGDKPWAIALKDDAEAISSEFDEVNALFSLRQRARMNAWSEDEAFIHSMALGNLAKNTGLTEESIDYMLFRSTSYHDNEVPKLPTWRMEMLDLYDAEYEALWQWYNADAADDVITILSTSDAEASAAVLVTPQTPQKALPAASVPTYKIHFAQHNKADGKCRHCRSKVKCVVARDETSERLEYCNRHFTKCSTNKCKNPANHTRHDGLRVCHEHARGMKECWADTFLKGAGYLVGTKE